MITQEIFAAVRRLEIRARRSVDSLSAGAYASHFRGRGMEFSEVREYAEGDEVRSIDWNVTARTGVPHVKIFTEERELRIHILADISGSSEFGSVRRRRALAAEVGAVLALCASRNRDRVALTLFSDREELHLPYARGRSQGLRIARELLAFQPQSKRSGIGRALKELMRAERRREIVFLLSDLMDEGWLDCLRNVAAKHEITVLHLLDPFELKASTSLPRVSVRDAETGELAELRGDGSLSTRQWAERTREDCLQAGAQYARLSTQGDWLPELSRCLGS
ncbi:MAG: hypothetical protein RL095_1457 [Verrucomicrobiota bacterium]|jgi:uncharacterized protein (DUF58 family)